MARNFNGERLQKQYIIDCLTESMNNSEYPEMIRESFKNNPLRYFAYRFKDEYNLDIHQNLQDAIADYIGKLAFSEIAFETHKQLELRDLWGYHTEDNRWCENFNSCIAYKIISLCRNENIPLR